MSATFGESFTRQGIDVAPFAARVASAAAAGEEANISPCSAATFGQEMFTSIRSGRARETAAAASANPSTVSAAMLAMSGTPRRLIRRRASSSSAASSSAPGFGRPMAFRRPWPQSSGRRVAVPAARAGRAGLGGHRAGAGPGGALEQLGRGAPDARGEHEGVEEPHTGDLDGEVGHVRRSRARSGPPRPPRRRSRRGARARRGAPRG